MKRDDEAISRSDSGDCVVTSAINVSITFSKSKPTAECEVCFKTAKARDDRAFDLWKMLANYGSFASPRMARTLEYSLFWEIRTVNSKQVVRVCGVCIIEKNGDNENERNKSYNDQQLNAGCLLNIVP